MLKTLNPVYGIVVRDEIEEVEAMINIILDKRCELGWQIELINYYVCMD
jgi:hypothetical protein